MNFFKGGCTSDIRDGRQQGPVHPAPCGSLEHSTGLCVKGELVGG